MSIAFAPAVRAPGSNRIAINVSKDGRPFGQLWTFANDRKTFHGWHAETLAGEYEFFEPSDLSAAAKKVAGFDAMAWMNRQ
jgi:hypothetical protein